MKKILRVLVIFSLLILVTGCGNVNKSPDLVAKEIVKRISQEKYDNIDELINLDDKKFLDEKSFKKYLKDKKLLISGNKTYEVVDYTVPEKDSKEHTVTIKTDDIFIDVDTIKIGEKWYVNLESYLYDELTFYVPKGSTVKLNGILLDKKYRENSTVDVRLSYTYEREKLSMNKYTINVLKDYDYKLEVEHEDLKKFKKNVNINIDNMSNVGVRSMDDYYIVIPKFEKDNETKIINYIKEYYNSVFESVNNKKKISSLKNYFVNENNKGYNNFKEKFEDDYNDLIEALKEEKSYSIEIKDDYKLTSLESFKDGIYYLGNDSIVFVGTLNYKYHHKFDYIDFMSSYNDTYKKDEYIDDNKNIAIVLKKEKDNYKIVWGSALIP